MRILQINSTVNSGSTGRIAEDIGCVLLEAGHESFIAYGRGNRPSKSVTYKIGSTFDVYLHFLKTAIFDRHALGSKRATRKLVNYIEQLKPDAIGLHNLHGYYINIDILFASLEQLNIPVLWTLFDCWAFTGHCSYFDNINCEKWKTGCESCPKTSYYPRSYLMDHSKKNFNQKKELFNRLKNIQIIVHSHWLGGLVGQSFLKPIGTTIIASGINVEQFSPRDSDLKVRLGIADKKVILGCASIWDKRKGLDDFEQLSAIIPSDSVIVLLGLNKTQIKDCVPGIIAIERTENVTQLAEFYSMADVFVNPTYQDNFPTTNLEALACGTPVITYNTGGSPEAIDANTGFIVEKGDPVGLKQAIDAVLLNGKKFYTANCRTRALQRYNKEDRYNDYINIFTSIIQNR